MKRFLIISFFLLNILFLSAQTEGVSINRTGADPDSSAILDIQSSTKGLLIPRMDSSSRIAISSPAEGLMVYDSTTQSFWYYQQAWQELGENIPAEIRDADTYVQVEATPDEDTIRLGVKGREVVSIDSAAMKVRANLFAGSVFEDKSSRIVDYAAIGSFRTDNSPAPDWQSFMFTGDGKLDFIALLFGGQSPSANYTVSLYEGEGTGGNLLSSTNYSSAIRNRWNQITFPNEITLRKSAIYTVRFSSRRAVGYEVGNLYPGGRGGSNPNRDYMLRVNVFADSAYEVSVVGGNVGIGTDIPAHALEVVGEVQLSSLRGSGSRMVVADSAGELTTQALPDYSGVADADNDTYIQVEANSDEDIIRLITAGKEAVNIDSTEMFVQTDFFAGRSFAASSSQIVNYRPVGSFLTNTSSASDWQSFAAPNGGKLDFIALYISSATSPSPNYTIRFYEGEGIGGKLLSSTNVSFPSPDWNQITLPDEITLSKGAIYTVGFSSRKAIGFEGGNLYPSGISGSNPDWDYMLRVNVFAEFYGLNVVDGKVGIGTANPTRAQVEIAGAVNHQITNALTTYSSIGPLRLPTGMLTPMLHSLYADGQIAASAFNAHSDARIKAIQGPSNSPADLNTLMQIGVTDYRMKDSLTKGNTPYKKVIAQQVAEVYPQAVTNTLTEVVPDIYQRAEVQDGWIMLPTDLQVGERVKVITASSSEVHEVTAVEVDRFQVSSLLKTENCKLETVFIYGREVDDFHTVDYGALSMLNVSATQAQQDRIEALKAKISALTRQLQAFQSLQAEQSRLAQELATLKAALQTQP